MPRRYRFAEDGSGNQHLLLLLHALHNMHGQLKHVRHYARRRQREPLCQSDVRDTIALVQLDPDQVLRVGGVLDVMSCLVLLTVLGGKIDLRQRRGKLMADVPLLSGKTAVSPGAKSNVRALPFPMKTVALPWPRWKYSHSSA